MWEPLDKISILKNIFMLWIIFIFKNKKVWENILCVLQITSEIMILWWSFSPLSLYMLKILTVRLFEAEIRVQRGRGDSRGLKHDLTRPCTTYFLRSLLTQKTSVTEGFLCLYLPLGHSLLIISSKMERKWISLYQNLKTFRDRD